LLPTVTPVWDDVDRPEITLAEVLEVELPLLRPFVTGFGVTDSRHTVLAHVVAADGVEGWGEGPALDHPTTSRTRPRAPSRVCATTRCRSRSAHR
jgi:L-alanine-DL-glutamate epimerase-like enolase superfamily enzyme